MTSAKAASRASGDAEQFVTEVSGGLAAERDKSPEEAEEHAATEAVCLSPGIVVSVSCRSRVCQTRVGHDCVSAAGNCRRVVALAFSHKALMTRRRVGELLPQQPCSQRTATTMGGSPGALPTNQVGNCALFGFLRVRQRRLASLTGEVDALRWRYGRADRTAGDAGHRVGNELPVLGRQWMVASPEPGKFRGWPEHLGWNFVGKDDVRALQDSLFAIPLSVVRLMGVAVTAPVRCRLRWSPGVPLFVLGLELPECGRHVAGGLIG